MRIRILTGCAVWLALFAAGRAAHAQEAAASVSGYVRDQDGRGLGAIAIVAQSPHLIRHLTTTSATGGEYALTSLPAGPYVIAFSREGLVPVKRTLWLSPGEHAIAHVAMHPGDGVTNAITVVDERLAFSPSEATSLDVRTELRQLPVTGTLRSIVGVSTTPAAADPRGALLLFDGLPLRHGWNPVVGPAFAGLGPEALRDLTMTPARLSADYGRFDAGVLSLVTSGGANRVAGSVRTDLGSASSGSDLPRSGLPVAGVGRTVEYTLRGPIHSGSTWFFAAGRHLAESVDDDTAFTDAPFTTTTRERVGTGRVTHAWSNTHRFEAQWIGARQEAAGVPPGVLRVADVGALANRELSDRAWSVAYVGLPAGGLQVSARYTREEGALRVSAPAPRPDDLVERTRVTDQETGVVAWASGACATCDPRRATHHTFRVTGAMLLPGRFAAHHVTMGVDVARDGVTPATRPAGGAFHLYATRFTMTDGTVRPVFEPDGSSWIAWSPPVDNRLRLQSAGLFLSDRWTVSDALSVNAGVRIDRHRATAVAANVPILAEANISPRISLAWRPDVRGPWTLTGGYHRYVGSPRERALDGSTAGLPAQRVFAYDGPSINAGIGDQSTPQAIRRVLDWFAASGGTSRPAWFASAPGLSTAADETLAAPHVDEWAAGLGRVLGEDGYARADVVLRTSGNVSTRRARSAAVVTDVTGLPVDAGRLVLDDRFERRDLGFTFTGNYRFGHWADVGAQYTLASIRGNMDGPSADHPAVAAAIAYPEFTRADWHLPVGALAHDATHRARAWLHSELRANEAQGTLTLSLLLRAESGLPYGASGLVGVRPYVGDEGYQQPPIAVPYFFTARDERRTPGVVRADAAVTYRRRAPGTVQGELFAQLDLLNLLGQRRIVAAERLAIARTAFTDPSLQPFDPFTETPVEGVHWTFDDDNVRRITVRESLASTLGRAVRLSMGIRF